jgi:putative peptidoglycan lipid II flippase
VLGQVLLRRRLGRIPTGDVLRTVALTLVASVVGGLLAYGVVLLLGGVLAGLSPLGKAWATLAIALVVAGPVTLLGMRLLRVRELDPLMRRLERIVDRVIPRRGTPR